MTLEEKREAIKQYCAEQWENFQCDDCPIYPLNESCWEQNSLVDAHYKLIFGENAVNHPEHYQGKHECIEEMVELFGVDAVIGFCKCNVYKYRYRADRKNGKEDIEKADWYMDKLIELQAEEEKQRKVGFE